MEPYVESAQNATKPAICVAQRAADEACLIQNDYGDSLLLFGYLFSDGDRPEKTGGCNIELHWTGSGRGGFLTRHIL